jgi:hypothetical protein
MAINPITNASIWMQQLAGRHQHPPRADSSAQNPEVQSSRKPYYHGGGMGQALMQTLSQLGLTMPDQSASSSQSVMQTNAFGDPNSSETQTSALKNDRRNFMHAFFQAVDAQEASASSAAATASAGLAGSNVESGLSSVISQLASTSTDLAGSAVENSLPSAISNALRAAGLTFSLTAGNLPTHHSQLASTSTGLAGSAAENSLPSAISNALSAAGLTFSLTAGNLPTDHSQLASTSGSSSSPSTTTPASVNSLDATPSDKTQNTHLQDLFNTLMQNLQKSLSNGSSIQQAQSLSLQTFLTALQQNLLYLQPISATGNVVITQA